MTILTTIYFAVIATGTYMLVRSYLEYFSSAEDKMKQRKRELGEWFINKTMEVSYLKRDPVSIDDIILDVHIGYEHIELLSSGWDIISLSILQCIIIKECGAINIPFAEEVLRIKVKNELK